MQTSPSTALKLPTPVTARRDYTFLTNTGAGQAFHWEVLYRLDPVGASELRLNYA